MMMIMIMMNRYENTSIRSLGTTSDWVNLHKRRADEFRLGTDTSGLIFKLVLSLFPPAEPSSSGAIAFSVAAAVTLLADIDKVPLGVVDGCTLLEGEGDISFPPPPPPPPPPSFPCP